MSACAKTERILAGATSAESTRGRWRALTSAIWDLGFIYGLCGTWERTVHCLKHLARVTVALEFQDIAWTCGPGADGLPRRSPPMGGDLGAFEAMPASCVCSIACLQLAARR